MLGREERGGGREERGKGGKGGGRGIVCHFFPFFILFCCVFVLLLLLLFCFALAVECWRRQIQKLHTYAATGHFNKLALVITK